MNEDNAENMSREMSMKYNKLGSAGIKGGLFQVNLLIVFMLNALEKTVNWRLSTENTVGGKFDDIIFECSDEAILLQAKHKQKSSYKITDQNLFSINSKKDEFSLAKYFFSYHEVKNNKKLKNVKRVIICTNANIEVNQGQTVKRHLTTTDMLYFEGCGEICHIFQDNIIPTLEENIRLYKDQNLKGKNICENIICKENIRDFLNHLHFISSYPSDNDLKTIIEDKIYRSVFGKNLNYKITSSFIFHEVMSWYTKDKGIYMDPISSKWIFCKILSYKYCEDLEKYEVFFENNNLMVKGGKKIIHIIPTIENLLYVIKIYRTLLQNESLFIPATVEEDIRFQIMDAAFSVRDYKYIVIIRSKTTTQNDDTFFTKVTNILTKKGKKVILITQKEDAIAKRLKETYNTFYGKLNYHILFIDFTKHTKKKFLNKVIKFQGKPISIGTLLPTNDSRNRVLTCDVLAKLLKDEPISIGKEIEQLHDINYISRIFRRHRVTCAEDDILKEKLIIISASAGMGKSTVLKKLATTLKKNSPHLWVIPVDLNRCTNILKHFQREGRIDVAELLNSQESIRLHIDMEKALFSVPYNVALMVDGVDEISPYYTDTVLKILAECKDSKNYMKIIVTTRPHLQKELEDKLEVEAWNLIPFTSREQIRFLQYYWSKNLNIQDPILEHKCEYYAEVLVNNVSMLTNDNSGQSFVGNPLQIRMLAEVFQEKSSTTELEEWEFCKEFVMSSSEEPNLPRRINFVRLYQLFIEKKRKIFVEEKGNPNGNVMAEEALKKNFKEWYNFHHVLALKDVVDDPYYSLFTCYNADERTSTKESLLKVGIVEVIGFNLHFVHRTFAEYFVAECILKELKCNNNEAFYNYLISLVFSSNQYFTVRVFLNDFLRGQSTLLLGTKGVYSMSILKTYWCLQTLAKENHTGILLLICVNCNCSKNKRVLKLPFRKKVCNVDIKDNLGRTAINIAAAMGHIDSVRCLVEQDANVDNSDFYGSTPLLEAARGGHFHVVQYLVAKGANINCRDTSSNTPLLEASRISHFDMVWFLIKNGADPNIRPVHGCTVLHWLVSEGQLELVQHVLQIGVEVNIKDQLEGMALHTAINTGNAPMVELLVKFGADVNAVNEGNWVAGGRFGWNELHGNQYISKNNQFVYNHMGGFSALHLAVALDDLKCAGILVDHNACVNVSDRCGCTPLHVAVRKGNLQMVKILINKHADPNILDHHGRTTLHEACCYSDFSADIITRSSKGNNVRFGKTPLREAVRGPHFNIVKYLVANGANIHCRDKYGNTPLLDTCNACHFPMAWFLIQKGADPNVRNDCNTTVLQSIASRGHRKLIQRVLDMGVEANVLDQRGGTALHIAINSGNIAIVKLLVKYGADVNAFNKYNWVFGGDFKWYDLHQNQNIARKSEFGSFTPLHLAVALDDVKSARILVEHNAAINVTDTCGCTPLHIAARKGNLRMMEILLKKDANPNMQDECGRTPLHEAGCQPSFFIYDLLVSFGADNSVKDENDRTPLDELIT